MISKLLIFHPAIAPYRISFFNDLYDHFKARICISYRNLKSQKFDYEQIENKLHFKPKYASKTIKLLGRTFYLGTTKEIREYHPETVVVCEYGEALWGAIIARFFSKNKYAIIIMSDDSKDYAEKCSTIRRISRNIGLKHANGVILCNDAAQAWYNNQFSIDTIVFPIIQKESEFSEHPELIIKRKNEIVREYNLVGRRVFLFVGRLAPEKNVEYLIDSFIKQIDENPENILFIIGGETDKAPGFKGMMTEIIKNHNADQTIVFVGRKEGLELRAWYEVGQILILPSKADAFGTVVNEALLAGEYVMVSNKAGAACLVKDHNGCVFDINKEYIDFTEVNRKIPTMTANHKQLRESKMPYTYREKMNELIDWINKVRYPSIQ